MDWFNLVVSNVPVWAWFVAAGVGILLGFVAEIKGWDE